MRREAKFQMTRLSILQNILTGLFHPMRAYQICSGGRDREKYFRIFSIDGLYEVGLRSNFFLRDSFFTVPNNGNGLIWQHGHLFP